MSTSSYHTGHGMQSNGSMDHLPLPNNACDSSSTITATGIEKIIISPTGKTQSPFGDEVVFLGDKFFLKEDLVSLLGFSDSHSMEVPIAKSSQSARNPAPLGLCSFATSTFILSLINAGACGVNIPHVVIGMGLWCGGILQIIAGVLAYFDNNMFGCVAFSSYGGFWLSFATILIDPFGVEKAYKGNEEQYGYAMGFFLLSWFLFSAMMTLMTLKTTISFMLLFVLLDCNFALLAADEFTGYSGCKVAAGVFGILDSIVAWYIAFSELADEKNSYITFNPTKLPGNPSHV